MAITDIVINVERVRHLFGDYQYYRFKQRMYAAKQDLVERIFLNLTLIFKENNDLEIKDPYKFLCHCISHEEIHNWLEDNFDLHTSKMFDNISYQIDLGEEL